MRGSNLQLNYKGKGTNLHSFWDSGVIKCQNISLKDCLKSKSYTTNEIKALQKMDLLIWGKESCTLLGSVYDYKKAKVGDDYVSQSGELIKKQIQKAGIRLAEVLKAFFK